MWIQLSHTQNPVPVCRVYLIFVYRLVFVCLLFQIGCGSLHDNLVCFVFFFMRGSTSTRRMRRRMRRRMCSINNCLRPPHLVPSPPFGVNLLVSDWCNCLFLGFFVASLLDTLHKMLGLQIESVPQHQQLLLTSHTLGVSLRLTLSAQPPLQSTHFLIFLLYICFRKCSFDFSHWDLILS